MIECQLFLHKWDVNPFCTQWFGRLKDCVSYCKRCGIAEFKIITDNRSDEEKKDDKIAFGC